MLSIRIKCDGLWLGAGMIWEESSHAGFQVTLRAAQDEAVSTGHKQGTTVIALNEQLVHQNKRRQSPGKHQARLQF